MTGTSSFFPPALILVAGAMLLPLLMKKIRPWIYVIFPLLTLLWIIWLPTGEGAHLSLGNFNLVLVHKDALSFIFGLIFSFIALAGSIYSFHLKDTAHLCASLLYAAGALGVTFAGDFLTLFIFWETMAFTSLYLIWARRKKESYQAGFRYLIYHALGGGILLAGLVLHFQQAGSLAITSLQTQDGLGAWLILVGVVINAAVPPLHTWLADAYPKATVTGAVFLSAFTTKAAVYVLLRVFPGWEVLLVAGSIMTVYGVVFAILANDIRGILSYHIISQVGYMVAGVGVGTTMGLNGSAAHAFSHILYKALLFMGTGAVLEATGRYKLTDLGGLSKKLKAPLILYMIAAFSISGVPLFNGFISKSMVVAAAEEAHHSWAMFLMLLASVGTFLSVGLKLPYFTWGGKDKGLQVKKLPANMYVAMTLVAFICILHGVMPGLLYQLLPFPVDYHPYSTSHLLETIQILSFTLVGFWLARRKLVPHAQIALDVDWLYRYPGKKAGQFILDEAVAFFAWTEKVARQGVKISADWIKNPMELPASPKTSYSPDRYRPPLRRVISWLLVVFILLIALSLI
ncbi:MAG: Na(+)/H(+) antiporter subunit D [Candidatus Aminicenantes bacterium 4484_214]|nr:MAG: Na(+)/H(+) antiporter subunit D [Candidatus Aminicenantes bacterium 4484_214]